MKEKLSAFDVQSVYLAEAFNTVSEIAKSWDNLPESKKLVYIERDKMYLSCLIDEYRVMKKLIGVGFREIRGMRIFTTQERKYVRLGYELASQFRVVRYLAHKVRSNQINSFYAQIPTSFRTEKGI
jgi:hypothetical protein